MFYDRYKNAFWSTAGVDITAGLLNGIQEVGGSNPPSSTKFE